MTRFHFERSDGPPSNNAQNILVHLNEFVPSQGFAGGEAIVEQLLLDLFPDAAAAYSLRLLRAVYTGPAIRVEETDTNTTKDIGFLPNGDLDVADLLDFVGSFDGLVKIIYDQSGNGVDLDDSVDNTFLPLIVIGGVLQTTNNLPSMFFDGINDNLFSSIGTSPSTITQIFAFGTWRKLDLLDDPTNFNLRSGTNPPQRVTGRAPLSNGEIQWNAGNETTEQLETTQGTFNDLFQHVTVFTRDGSIDELTIRRDAEELAQRLGISASIIVGGIDIGANGPSGVDAANMQWQELVFYNDIGDVEDDVSDIENNVLGYWKNGDLITELGDQLVTDTGDPLVYV